MLRSPNMILGLAAVLIGCGSGGRPRDVAGDRGRHGDEASGATTHAATAIPAAPRVSMEPANAKPGNKARPFVRASTRAIALDAANVYYGDTATDAIYAMPKAGGQTVRLARHAPVAGAIAVDSDSITWIASPGDSVLKLPLRDGDQPATLRDRGIFSDVATVGGDVFIVEAVGGGGALLRVTGPTAARLATFDGSPRAVVVDPTHAYVITPNKILRTTHVKGEVETLATGVAFASPQLDESFLYVVTEIDKVRVVARLPKAGGPTTVLARDVRDLPIDLEGGEVFYFDASHPQVRAVRVTGGDPRVVVENETLATSTAIAIDATTVYVAAGAREGGTIYAVDRR